jgi:hypothetical protein
VKKTVIIGHGAWFDAPVVAGQRFGYRQKPGELRPEQGDLVAIQGDFGLYVYNAGTATITEVTDNEVVFANDFQQDPYAAAGRKRPGRGW